MWKDSSPNFNGTVPWDWRIHPLCHSFSWNDLVSLFDLFIYVVFLFHFNFQPWFVSYTFDHCSLEWWSLEILILLSGLLPNPKLETSVLSVWYVELILVLQTLCVLKCVLKLLLLVNHWFPFIQMMLICCFIVNCFSDQFKHQRNNLHDPRINWISSKVLIILINLCIFIFMNSTNSIVRGFFFFLFDWFLFCVVVIQC